MAFLNEDAFLRLQIPKSPSHIMRSRGHMLTHWMEVGEVNSIFVALQHLTLLVLKIWTHGPQANGSVR